MDLGLPLDLTWSKALTDLGSLIGGGFAIIAGVLAYRAGVIQANATRVSADKQIAAAATERANADAAAAEAIRREIIECTKVVIEALRICECMKSGHLEIMRRNAHSIMMNPDPIVYRAVADRIGRLPYDPQFVVSFYMRMVYIQQTIEIIVVGNPGDDGAPVPGEEAETLAKSLIMTCQLARAIISHVPSPSLVEEVSQITLGQIDAALESAKQSFPKLFRKRTRAKSG
jgi:hypothetical protein